MNPRLELLYCHTASENLRRMGKLAEFFGIATCFTEVRDFGSNHAIGAATGAVVADVAGVEPTSIIVDAIASANVPLLLLFSGGGSDELVRHISRNAINSLRAGEGTSVQFGMDSEYAGELASHNFSRPSAPALWLECNSAKAVRSIMRVGAGEAFVTWSSDKLVRFAWATPTVRDISAIVESELDFELSLDQIIPFIVFLRHAFGERCWHNPSKDAGFIIDDPLLIPKYGLIDFSALLASARRHSYHVTLAFIPWNAWRSRQRHVQFFRKHADCFSICVHGCDHNQNEYGARDYDLLLDKNRIAIERMDAHAKRLDMPYVPIMVCPQEQCSLEAWRSFADNRRLLAMMNTRCLPRHSPNNVVSIQDLLLPANDAFFGFPIFKRYYSDNRAGFALSLFLGKPAILVEHHQYFGSGLDRIEEFVHELRRISPRIQWRNIEALVTTTHARRRTSPSSLEVQFFANRFQFESADVQGCSVLLRKRIPERSALRRIRVNGAEAEIVWDGEYATVYVPSVNGGIQEIDVEMAPVSSSAAYSFSPWYQGGVVIRRVLSELRDNVISRNPRALNAAQSVVRALGLRGGAARSKRPKRATVGTDDPKK